MTFSYYTSNAKCVNSSLSPDGQADIGRVHYLYFTSFAITLKVVNDFLLFHLQCNVCKFNTFSYFTSIAKCVNSFHFPWGQAVIGTEWLESLFVRLSSLKLSGDFPRSLPHLPVPLVL